MDKKLISEEMERMVLGAAMISPQQAIGMRGSISAASFAFPLHGRIWEALQSKIDAGESPSPINLSPLFANDTEMPSIGALKYLFSIAGGCTKTDVLSADNYAHALASMATLRDFMSECRSAMAEMENLSFNRSGIDVILSHARNCQNLLKDFTGSKIEDCGVIGERVADIMLQPARSYRTGIPELDTCMGGGLHEGKAYGFAARKKIGKTILASSISFNLNLSNVKHLFICGEMSPEEIQSRNLCRALEAFPSHVREGRPELAARIREYSQLAPKNILYHNAPGITLEQLQSVVSSAIVTHGIKGFILDYWQLVEGKRRDQSTAEHLGCVAQWIATVCNKHRVWAIVTAQLNQDGNTRGSEGMRLAFDQVYQIQREDITQPDTWLEMMDTRYTAWGNVGSKTQAGLWLEPKGPYFKAIGARA
jgi:replicative DNA helicase